jgi:Fe2+ or Zn2+ uptake regulation protein
VADDLHPTIHARLADAGQRYTSGRRDLVEVLARSDRPLTAAEVGADGGLSQSSAYRNLAVLEEAGVVHRIAGSDDFARFELAEDLTDHHHHHLICVSCGSVADFTVSDGLEAALESAMGRVAATTGFSPDRHRLDLLGRCAACR